MQELSSRVLAPALMPTALVLPGVFVPAPVREPGVNDPALVTDTLVLLSIRVLALGL